MCLKEKPPVHTAPILCRASGCAVYPFAMPKPASPARSPAEAYRRSWRLHVVYDVLHITAAVSIALLLFSAPHVDFSSLACANSPNSTIPCSPSVQEALQARWQAVLRACVADPLEALSAGGIFVAWLSMMGNSPLAWAVVIGIHSIDDAAWAALMRAAESQFGTLEEGGAAFALGALAYLCFLIPYLVQVWPPPPVCGGGLVRCHR